jgi:hypothetical protein
MDGGVKRRVSLLKGKYFSEYGVGMDHCVKMTLLQLKSDPGTGETRI